MTRNQPAIDTRVPNMDHEHILSGLTSQPDSFDVILRASDTMQKILEVGYNWPKNVAIFGLLYQQLWNVYCAGERRGVARSDSPVTALFPIPKPAK